MFAVAGVTGQTGRVVADTLLTRGHDVRVIVRDALKGAPWAARGAEVAVAALGDEPALTRALTDVQGAYLLTPPDAVSLDFLASRRQLTDALVAAVAASQVPHVVFLSSIGAHLEDPRIGPIAALRYGEQRLRRLTGQAVTLLRAPYFTENWLLVGDAVMTQGVLPSFVPLDTPFEMASVGDIGRVAAESLIRGGAGFRLIELAGPAPVTVTAIAAELGTALGRTVQPVRVPLDQVEPTFTGIGISADLARLYRLMYEGLQAGILAFESPETALVRGTVTPGAALGAALVPGRARTV